MLNFNLVKADAFFGWFTLRLGYCWSAKKLGSLFAIEVLEGLSLAGVCLRDGFRDYLIE